MAENAQGFKIELKNLPLFFGQVSAIKIHCQDITPLFSFWKHLEMEKTVKVLNSQAFNSQDKWSQ